MFAKHIHLSAVEYISDIQHSFKGWPCGCGKCGMMRIYAHIPTYMREYPHICADTHRKFWRMAIPNSYIYMQNIYANAITYPQYHLAAKWGVGSAESEGDSGHLHPCHQVSMMLMLMLITNEDMMMLKMIMPVFCS